MIYCDLWQLCIHKQESRSSCLKCAGVHILSVKTSLLESSSSVITSSLLILVRKCRHSRFCVYEFHAAWLSLVAEIITRIHTFSIAIIIFTGFSTSLGLTLVYPAYTSPSLKLSLCACQRRALRWDNQDTHAPRAIAEEKSNVKSTYIFWSSAHCTSSFVFRNGHLNALMSISYQM